MDVKRQAQVLFILIFTFFFIPSQATAYQGSTEVMMRVPGSVATVSGISSPLAQVAATLKNLTLKTTVADQNSNFLLEDIGLASNAKELCFTQSDVKSFGSSDSCITFKPGSRYLNFKDVFLPPTIGFVQDKIKAGESAVVRGYTVAGANVLIQAKGTSNISLNSDMEGYYEGTYKNLTGGIYFFSASATFQGKKSLNPQRQIMLEVATGAAGLFGKPAGAKQTFFSQWLIPIIFLIAAVSGLLIIFAPRTRWGMTVMIKLRRTKIYSQIYSLLYKLKLAGRPVSIQSQPAQSVLQTQPNSSQSNSAKGQSVPQVGKKYEESKAINAIRERDPDSK